MASFRLRHEMALIYVHETPRSKGPPRLGQRILTAPTQIQVQVHSVGRCIKGATALSNSLHLYWQSVFELSLAMAEPETFGPRLKKLKRMPHIFSQVLELPFPSDFPVNSEETETAFRFAIKDPEMVIDGTVKAEVLRIVPGAKKVVLRGVSRTGSALSELETWRFRLPPCTNPDATSASYKDGVLTVVVPKSWSFKEDKCDGVVAEDNGSAVSVGPVSPISVF